MPKELTFKEKNKCFERLDWFLSQVMVQTEHGDPREASADEFMLMHTEGNLGFKHINTRNYVFILPNNRLYVPVTNNAFMRGFFDNE